VPNRTASCSSSKLLAGGNVNSFTPSAPDILNVTDAMDSNSESQLEQEKCCEEMEMIDVFSGGEIRMSGIST
jgi:hypothetical protein